MILHLLAHSAWFLETNFQRHAVGNLLPAFELATYLAGRKATIEFPTWQQLLRPPLLVKRTQAIGSYVNLSSSLWQQTVWQCLSNCRTNYSSHLWIFSIGPLWFCLIYIFHVPCSSLRLGFVASGLSTKHGL